MQELTSLKDLAQSLKGMTGRIGIDGCDGTRKTSTTDFLAQALGTESIHLDDFLFRERGGYVDFIDYPRLEAALRQKPQAIVEGVCLLQVVQRAKGRIDTLIYIKRYHLGLWSDERQTDVPPAEIDAFLEKEREFASMLSGEAVEEGPSMHDDLVRYHSTLQPHHRAQITFRWDEL